MNSENTVKKVFSAKFVWVYGILTQKDKP